MEIREFDIKTEEFLKIFMEKNGISKGEVWEQHELKALMEEYHKSFD